MSIFRQVVKKDWQVPVKSTTANKKRFENVQAELAKLDPNASLELSDILEKKLEDVLKKAESEIEKMKDARQKEEKKDTPLSGMPSSKEAEDTRAAVTS